MTKRQRAFLKGFLQAGALAGSLTALVGLWHLLGMPTPAWSSDIQKLNLHQSEMAIDIYNSRVRGLLATAPPADPVAKQSWDEELRQARQKLDDAEKRRIELSK
ncbi:MAG TPA: hypothetical protein VMH83_07670 [Candidatus Acidoferrum sp.]|nr:hypothetical protein [Candidatus Acidoferrum sp.]